jgi:ubiquinone/menaquinone biosynthesis C-methylase UbiE
MTTNTNPRPHESSAIQDTITGYWDWRGAAYDEAPRHGIHHPREKEAWLAALRDLLPAAPADVLDVGAGTGFLALLIAELGHRVVGIDLAVNMLAAGLQKSAGMANAPAFMYGDAHDPPLPAWSFDVVTNRHVMWTLTDPPRALAAWYRLLRPGGRLLAIDGLWWLERAEPAPNVPLTPTQQKHKEHYTPEVEAALPLRQATSIATILAMVRDAGFTDVHVTHLDAVAAVEREVLPDTGRMTQPRYVLHGVRPAVSSSP